MNPFDKNQQSPPYRKRKCIVYKPNDFFQAFDFSQHEIITNYEKSAEHLMIQSLSILVENIRKAAKGNFDEPSSPKREKSDIKQQFYSLKKSLSFNKKNFEQSEENESTNPERQVEEFVKFQRTGKKPQKNIEYCIQQKKSQPNFSHEKKHQKLLDSLRKLTVEQDEFREFERQFYQPKSNYKKQSSSQEQEQTQANMDDYKHKTVDELIYESNAKNKSNQNKQYSPIESENSEYDMTDHSSNESSNDEGDYEERFSFEEHQTPSFSTIFQQSNQAMNFFFPGNNLKKSPIFGDSNPPKTNFKAILDSPKKSKTKRKRLYINNKKVPKWAQDREILAQQFSSDQQRRLRQNADKIFGVCIVQDMQTNTIFNRKDEYKRSSTVKWQRNRKYIV